MPVGMGVLVAGLTPMPADPAARGSRSGRRGKGKKRADIQAPVTKSIANLATQTASSSAPTVGQGSSLNSTALDDVQEVDGDAEEHDLLAEDMLREPEAQEPLESKSVCAERWRNAGPEARKKMFALFAVTGIFASLCRHGQVLVLCDMVRSGEL